ncbi:MAG: alpha/beta fold hydrolase [Oligoflexales bacterium]|nr:alpha/beta fold hydrolase [Oligoflexales bacterium]
MNSSVKKTVTYICPVDHKGSTVSIQGSVLGGMKNTPIIIVHDLGETFENYAAFSEYCLQTRFHVYGFDMRWSLQDQKNTASSAHLNQLILDLLQVLTWVKYNEDGQKPILIGQGAGALVALFLAAEYTQFCAGLVLTSPLLFLDPPLGNFSRKMIQILSQIAPNFHTPRGLCPNFTGLEFRAHRGLFGPLSPSQISNQLANELLDAMSQVRKTLQVLKLPSYLLCAGEDPLCKPDFLQRWFQRHRWPETLKLSVLPSSQHRLLSKEGQMLEQSMGLLLPWLEPMRT